MNILLVNTSLLRGRGSDHVVAELAGQLSRQHKVKIVAPFGGDIDCGGVEVIGRGNETKGRLRRLIAAFRVIVGIWWRKDYDVLNCHHALLSVALPAWRLVTTYHGYTGRFHYRLGPRVAKLIRGLVEEYLIAPALRRGCAATVVSATLAQSIARHMRSTPIEVIHNGVTPDDRVTDSRLPADSYFLYCGRIDRDKAVDVLVARYAKLDLRVPLLLAGEGPLRPLLQSKYLRKGIVFVGLKTRSELAQLYENALAFVTASTHETFCLPVIEAAAYGCPSIAPDSGAMIEVIRPGETGYLVANEQAFAEQLRIIFQLTAADRVRMRNACIEWAAQFTWSHKVEEYVGLYQRVTGARCSAP